MSEVETRPCPFCGGKVSRRANSFICIKCGYSLTFNHSRFYTREYKTEKQRHNAMLEVWNKREMEE